MSTGAKLKKKIQERLGELRAWLKRPFRWGCAVCGSKKNLKTSRTSEGLRCKPCLDQGKTTPEVEEYEALKVDLARLNRGNS